MFVEIAIGIIKWLFCYSYKPHKGMMEPMEFYTLNYEEIFLMGDFNSKTPETSTNSFCKLYNLKYLV